MSRSGTIGRLAIVLHTHMPEVLGHGVWPFGEQWLWEAIGESYLKVADAIEGHPVTLGVTPVLADQFEALRGEAGDRYPTWVTETREYVFGEDMRSFHEVGRGDLNEALAPQLADHRGAVARLDGELGRDLNGLLASLASSGVELLAGPATHPVMPLLASRYGRELQLQRGLQSHRERFGEARGIWLPECAFTRGLDEDLARAGVEYFCVDQSGVHGELALENLEPIATPAGPVALPIDWHTVKQVWDEAGFPSADAYRSTFARTIHDLMPYDNLGKAWQPAAARALAEAHADKFLRALAARLEHCSAERGQPGSVVFAADTELFGHWWYEGPWWLAAVLARAADYGIELVTLGGLVDSATPTRRAVERSSWGTAKSLITWDSPRTAEIVFAQRRAELVLEAASAGGALDQAALATAERELLALQASDWAFMESGDRTGDYGARRFAGHLSAFEHATLQPTVFSPTGT
jgi:1,4-alpha-glucan branching enzyme